MSKMSIQEKIADLERRVMALEQKQPKTIRHADIEPEWTDLWRTFDKLVKKAFR